MIESLSAPGECDLHKPKDDSYRQSCLQRMPADVSRECSANAVDASTEKERIGLEPAPRGAFCELQL